MGMYIRMYMYIILLNIIHKDVHEYNTKYNNRNVNVYITKYNTYGCTCT